MSAVRNIGELASAVAPPGGGNEEGATATEDPPLPDEEAPPLPDEPVPTEADDGWDAQWDATAQDWYFINSKTGVTQWENPRVPQATTSSHVPTPISSAAHASSSGALGTSSPPSRRKWGGYNPAIHGSYDPNADYALEAQKEEEAEEAAAAAAAAAAGFHGNNLQDYTAQAHFNRFTGKFQQAGVGPAMHNDENKSKRQMTAFFDVDAAANCHDGRSLKAERRNKTLSKKELKAVKEKRKADKEHKRRAWLLQD
ncbi:hypothetical protein BDU57DRAFT_585203 [Ampelomyces quisqualis]|uniref:WW domain-containing protein n=1 Tax=Ampelomyces quisqualis TaxID=50730 RepID=A0A6A5QTX2_AMPQU|nr:hypothetical protein BDU57DRAFT_585203 [Ampelomyces quisqualis]